MRDPLVLVACFSSDMAKAHAEQPPEVLIFAAILLGLGIANADPGVAQAVTQATHAAEPTLISQGEQAAAKWREALDLDA